MQEMKEENPQHGRSRRKGAARAGENRTGSGAERRVAKTRSASFIRIRRVIIFAVLEVIVLFGIRTYASILKQYNKIQRTTFEAKNVENTELSQEDLIKMKGYWNIAVFGVDSRNSSLGRGNNSDVIMVVSLNRETGDIRIVSIYRDSYLAVTDKSCSKINSAYAMGGPEQAVRALNQNLDLNITDYVTFNWKAVATGINILGGVDVDISKAEFKYINSYITETVKGTGIGSVQLKQPGMNHLDGVQAVAYARLRYMDNDYTRTERQRKIIGLCVEKAKKADAQTLSDLAGNLLSMVATSLTWEDGMSLAGGVSRYRIDKTTGFPEERKEINMGPKGACVIPDTLESNVISLHDFLFADADYAVSSQVEDIQYRIQQDISRYRNANTGTTKSSRGGSESETGEKEGSSREEKETDENGDVISDGDGKKSTKTPETDENGEIILGTDENGDVIYETNAAGERVTVSETETDENGRVIYNNGEPAEPETDEEGRLITSPASESTSGSGRVQPGETAGTTAAAVPGTTSTSRNSDGPGKSDEDYVNEGPGASTASTETTAHSTSGTAGTTAAQKPAETTAGSAAPTAAQKPAETTAAAATTASGNSSSGGPGSGSAETVEAVPQ